MARFLICALLVPAWISSAIAAERLSITRIQKHRFVETSAVGVKRVYEGYGADIEAPPGTAHEAMERFARRLFDTRLRAMNESAGGDLVWITFYLGGGQRPDGTVLRQTYRVIYVREGGQWRTPSARGSGRA